MKHSLLSMVLLLGFLGYFPSAFGGPLRDGVEDRLEGRRAAAQPEGAGEMDPGELSTTGVRLPPEGRLERDLPYGDDPQQRLDVYIPGQVKAAPVILMVHGGAWMIGDKAASAFVSNKVAHWLPKGCVIVSSNYRMSRRPNPLEQADDIARALAFVQAKAISWGGDPARVLLVGHSAGAHLVSLLAADQRIVTGQGGAPWLGTIVLDSAAFNVVEIMRSKHYGFYDRAFGKDRALWTEASPYHRLTAAPAPMFLVCSSRRSDACPQARVFSSKAVELGGRVTVLPMDLTHAQVNQELGRPSEYTTAVEDFMRTLGLH